MGRTWMAPPQVRFNDLPASAFSVINNTSLQATVPANATTGFITVYTPGGTATWPPFSF